MLKFPNTRYSKAWKQHVKPPSEMEYSRVINRKRWEEAIPCIWGNYEAQCLPAALARPSFVENSGRVKAARTNSTPLPREFLPSFRVATTAFASVLMSANIVAEWRGCAARFAFPFHGGASWMREGEREREGTRPGKNSSTSPSRGGILSSRVKSGFRWVERFQKRRRIRDTEDNFLVCLDPPFEVSGWVWVSVARGYRWFNGEERRGKRRKDGREDFELRMVEKMRFFVLNFL